MGTFNADVIRVVPDMGHEPDVQHLPENVARYYVNAIRAFEADLPDAAAVELRRTLEAATSHFGMHQRTLVDRVRGLIEAGLITKQFGDVLTHIRKLGNLGAHATDEQVSDLEASRALRFTTQVLRNLFEIPAELAAVSSTSTSGRSTTRPQGSSQEEAAAAEPLSPTEEP